MTEALARVKRGEKSQDFRFLCAQGWLAEFAGSRVLDLGCGGGIYLRLLGELGSRAVGVDLGLQTLRLARGYLGEEGAELCCASGLALPFADNSFAGIICIEVLSHIPSELQPAALAEMARVLVPGGVLIMSVHGQVRLALQRLVRLQRPLSAYANQGMTIYPLSRAQLLRSVEQSGFRLREGLVYTNLYNSLHQRFPGLFSLLTRVEDVGRAFPLFRSVYLTLLGKFQKA